MKLRPRLSDDPEPWLGKLRTVVHRRFTGLQLADREDLVQEAIRIALTRKMLGSLLTWRQATSLLIDAFRLGSRYRMREFASQYMTLVADSPNQITDMEARNKALSPEEQTFEDMLETETALNLAREAECRYLLGSSPLVPTDLLGLLPS